MNHTNNKLYRAFIAFEIPERVSHICSRIQQKLAHAGIKGKWVKQDNHHITIYFLGNKSLLELQSINNKITSLKIDKSQICFELLNLNTFGRPPKVLLVNLSDLKNKAAKTVEQIISINSLSEENKNWIPHLTLSRFRNKLESKTSKKIVNIQIPDCKFSPTQITVFISKLTQEGPIYIPLENFKEINEN